MVEARRGAGFVCANLRFVVILVRAGNYHLQTAGNPPLRFVQHVCCPDARLHVIAMTGRVSCAPMCGSPSSWCVRATTTWRPGKPAPTMHPTGAGPTPGPRITATTGAGFVCAEVRFVLSPCVRATTIRRRVGKPAPTIHPTCAGPTPGRGSPPRLGRVSCAPMCRSPSPWCLRATIAWRGAGKPAPTVPPTGARSWQPLGLGQWRRGCIGPDANEAGCRECTRGSPARHDHCG